MNNALWREKIFPLFNGTKITPEAFTNLSQPIKSFKLYSNAFALKAEYYHSSQPQRSSFLILLISFIFSVAIKILIMGQII